MNPNRPITEARLKALDYIRAKHQQADHPYFVHDWDHITGIETYNDMDEQMQTAWDAITGAWGGLKSKALVKVVCVLILAGFASSCSAGLYGRDGRMHDRGRGESCHTFLPNRFSGYR
jgi:hypothetical protein